VQDLYLVEYQEMTKDAKKLQLKTFDFLVSPAAVKDSSTNQSEIVDNIYKFLKLTDKSLDNLLSGFNQHQIARD